MIGVSKKNVPPIAVTRNVKKRFEEDRMSSVATINSVLLTPANTALLTASVEKETETTYFK